jgi:hypothetical protein
MFLVSSASLYAQGTPSEGKDYYLGFLYPSYNTVVPTQSAGYFRVYALISSFQDNTAYISYFNADGTEIAAQPYKLQARKTAQIPLSIGDIQITADQTKQYKSVHITAKKPINVVYYSTGGCSGGMYLCLPTNTLGTKYVVSSYHDNPSAYGARVGDQGPSFAEPSRGYYQIIGTQNGTLVSISNSVITSGGTVAKEPYVITLNRGQCYMVRSRNQAESDDISGSIIESDKPVVVLAGHENAQIGDMDSGIEQRDFMIEQMMPYDFLDSTGYIVVPMIDGAGVTQGKGDIVRINLFNDAMNVKPNIATSGNPITVNSLLKKYETLQYDSVKYPSSFSADNKISVMQYDMGNHGSAAPFARPSMMSIVPRSRWRNAYLWFVPSDYGLGGDKSYITIIGPKTKLDSIYISKNGQKDVFIGSAGLAKVTEYLTIPDHADLKAVVYQLVPGSYYARSNFSFMIYHYGYCAAAADNSLSNNNNNELYHSYATPLGATLIVQDTFSMTVKVDTLCSGWRICATDHHPDGAIKNAFLMDDPFGDIYPYDPNLRGPYQYYNTSFTPDLDPNATREIIFDGLDSTECLEVTIDNIGKDGYAPLFITDKNGNGKMVELYYKKRVVTFKPDFPEDGYYPSYFGKHLIKQQTDSVITVINLSGVGQEIPIHSVQMMNGKEIKVVSTSRTIPTVLSLRDTMRITIRFTPQDTGHFRDTLSIVSDCFTKKFMLDGNGVVGLIAAADHTFRNIAVDKKFCSDTVSVRNVGNLPFTLLDKYVLTDTVNFSFDTSSIRASNNRVYPLPVVIPSGDFVRLNICYHPTTEGEHSAELILQSDIPSPYTTTLKNSIKLKGTGTSSTKVIEDLLLEELRIHPNPTLGEDITASFGLTEPKELRFAVYDMLGREVVSIPSSYFAKGKQSVRLPVSKLGEGGYILRVSDSVLTRSSSFKVIK